MPVYQRLSEIMTDLYFPMDAPTMDVVGQITSLATGAMMAMGIGAYSIFAKSKSAGKQEIIADRTLKKSYGK